MFNRLIKFGMIAVLSVSSLLAQAQAFADLLQKAQSGDAKAQFNLAFAYIMGNGVIANNEKGIEWLRKSADQGYAGAEVALGYLYEKGMPGHPADPHQAASWFKKAARQYQTDPKHAQNAQTDLSKMLAQGLISKHEADWRDETATQSVQPGNGQKSRSFSLAEVETGLTGGITSKRMATLVSTYGVDFSLSAHARKRLADDGADDGLLAAISTSHH